MLFRGQSGWWSRSWENWKYTKEKWRKPSRLSIEKTPWLNMSFQIVKWNPFCGSGYLHQVQIGSESPSSINKELIEDTNSIIYSGFVRSIWNPSRRILTVARMLEYDPWKVNCICENNTYFTIHWVNLWLRYNLHFFKVKLNHWAFYETSSILHFTKLFSFFLWTPKTLSWPLYYNSYSFHLYLFTWF